MFSVSTLLNIYNLIELICWKQFKENLNDEYKMNLTDEIKKEIKEYLNEYNSENNCIKQQDIANAVRRLISRYLSGKRGDLDISEYKKLFDYIQRTDLWRSDLIENYNFETELFNIFEKLKKITRIVIECNEKDNKCDKCNKNKKEGIKNPCQECDNCKWGLRIGHALEFFEIINEEVFNINKYEENEKDEINSEFNGSELNLIKDFNEENDNNNNGEENSKSKKEQNKEKFKNFGNDYIDSFRNDDDQDI